MIYSCVHVYANALRDYSWVCLLSYTCGHIAFSVINCYYVHVCYCIEELQLGVPSPLASDCGSLIPPLNGMIETSGTKFGDFAEYSCIPGFSLVGERTRTCGHSGVWSGVDPVCLRKC